MIRTTQRTILYHILGCCCFLGLALALCPHPPEERILMFSPPTQRDFLANALMLVFFYLNYFLLIPRLFFPRKYGVYFVCVAAGLALVLLLPSLFTGRLSWQSAARNALPGPMMTDPIHKGPPPHPDQSFLQEVDYHIFLFLVVVFCSLFLRVRSRLLMTEKQKVDAELSFLKSQINPHFLFNALNSIYAMAVKKDEKIANAVVNLSDLMRYMIKDAHEAEVALKVELANLTNYVALQRSRLRDTALIDFVIKGETGDKVIAPLLLMPFVENAFKYGVNPDDASPARVHIDLTEEGLTLETSNKKVKRVNEYESTGIGIENARERLQLLYPEQHALKIVDEEEYFFVTLKITMK